MKDNNYYGSVITEQGDLGLGVFPINESAKSKRQDRCPNCGSELNHGISGGAQFDTCRSCGWKKAY